MVLAKRHRMTKWGRRQLQPMANEMVIHSLVFGGYMNTAIFYYFNLCYDPHDNIQIFLMTTWLYLHLDTIIYTIVFPCHNNTITICSLCYHWYNLPPWIWPYTTPHLLSYTYPLGSLSSSWTSGIDVQGLWRRGNCLC